MNLCCLTSRNDGAFLSLNQVAFGLRLEGVKEAAKMMADLVSAGLVEETQQGFRPRDWETKQRKSDTSKERTRKYRAKDK
jgi:hypothetical protein